MPDWLAYTQNSKSSLYLPANYSIFNAGELVKNIYILCSGKAKVTLEKETNKVDIIRLAGSGQVLGHRGFSEKMVYPISAKTLNESEIASISNEDFFKLVRENKDLAVYMMMFFADELLLSEQTFQISGMRTSQEKVAYTLVRVINAFGYADNTSRQIDFGISLHELATFANISRTSFSRTLAKFIEEGILRKRIWNYYVADEAALAKLAGMEIQ
ncbi:MAG: Crp/Fnr family transcriptional regulator [Bacteroidales bacterium]|nr:Crp/Fnr family transcriptional regulator [Bacteroidales bacterium]